MKESLNKSPSKMKRKAHGTQKARHNMGLGEPSSTTQRSDSLEQAFMQCFLNSYAKPQGRSSADQYLTEVVQER